jgi:adenylylsulfate kinase-like enzyme
VLSDVALFGGHCRASSMVIWLIGVSGAGKSTHAKRLLSWLEKHGRPACLLDGDDVRAFFEGDLGFSAEDRRANVKRIIFGSYMAHAAGRDCVVACISPFEELRQFARRKIPGYIEIHLKREMKSCIANDEKGIYQQNLGRSDIVGVDIAFDPPRASDLVIEVDGQSEDQVFEQITSFLGRRCMTEL